MSKTKIVCTIGPKTCQYNQLHTLATIGMNVARLNMSHGDHEWHRNVIKGIKTLNEKGEHSIAILLDTKGPEVRSGDLKKEVVLQKGDKFTFTIRREAEYAELCTEVNYDGFIDDVSVGDTILIDSGIMTLKVEYKTETDITCVCLDGGTMSSRRHLNVKGKSANLPSITEKDWEDIHFGIEEGVDFIALSFVKTPEVVSELKKYLHQKDASIDVIAKIESAEALDHLDNIITESDGAMVARGDLGAEVNIADVPLIQAKMVQLCKAQGKPVIVATHMLESMIVHPTPTRAEVTDITYAVMQGTDATMLSGETAAGKYPLKALQTMKDVIEHIEKNMDTKRAAKSDDSEDSKKELSRSAAAMAGHIGAKAILVFTRRGYMATLLSRCRPQSTIFAFTNMSSVRRKLNLYWGTFAYRIQFSSNPEKTIQRAITVLEEKSELMKGDQIIVVSDMVASDTMIETIQVRTI